MRSRLPHKKDSNHKIVPKAMRDRCGGYEQDKQYSLFHYANLQGLKVAAYDLHKVGGGIPDWLVYVGTFAIFFEVKEERPERKDKRGVARTLSDKEYYYGQLEPAEKFFYWHHPAIVAIVWDQNQVFDWLEKAAYFVNLQETNYSDTREFLELYFPKLKDQQEIEK